ncbi:MAG: hypothetical protein ACRELB_18720, partial [Polyangiaceae bacterium]
MLARAACFIGILACASACNRTGWTHETATVTVNGKLEGTDASGKAIEGIRVTFDACPDLASDVYFAKASPGGADLPPATVTCLRALAVGTK